MLTALIKVQVVDKLCTKAVFRQHTFDCHPYKLCRFLLENLFRCGETLSSRIACMTDVHLVGHLISGKPDLVGVDNDHIVPAVKVRGVARFVLTTEDKGYTGSKTSEHQVGGINENPLFLDIASLERYCFVTLCVHCLDL